MNAFPRISHDANIMGGKACIKGTRVTVGMILTLIGAGKTPGDVLDDYPYITHEDIMEAVNYGAWLAEGKEDMIVFA